MKQPEAKIPPLGKVRLSEAIECLVQLYEAMDKKDEAAKWRKELEMTKTAQKKPEFNHDRSNLFAMNHSLNRPPRERRFSADLATLLKKAEEKPI
jgi:hypothetical protein